ncbi:MAG: alkaline phosphatase [Bacteroidales bacterium]|nr:alkaline phosphatase [Bacteroidales bacterium]
MKRFILVTGFMISLAVVFSSFQDGKAPEQTTKEEHSVSNPKNIVLMIGDGMGVSQIYAGMTVSKEPLVFEQFQNIGFQKTYSKSDYTTDSGASGTALATGEKTDNGHISVTPSGEDLTTILELAEQNGLATGLASTSSILHATPASFIAHNKDRNNYEDLAADFLETDIDVFIGGGRESFADREDGKDLIQALKHKDYQVLFDIDEIKEVEQGKLAGFTAEGHNPRYSEGRGDMLPIATQTALNILDNNTEGFFLMVEGSQIDWGGHDNNTDYIVEELLDFNRACEVAMDFARENPNTLVIVTTDHETGGMGLNGGSLTDHTVDAGYTTGGHTGVMVPVFAFGPGAEEFQGIYDNTEIFEKMKNLYGF